MNRGYRPPPSLFSHREEPVVTSFAAGVGVVCRPVFSSVVSYAAAAGDAAVPDEGDR
ncbi:hypothetical protein [Nocardia brevicatena]|uniref:hypothetical protein n=1 Tax=Nocardia brevicatena TaxID=37327 RepID=UPI0002D7E06D|nr:hypothetical protein [Nocardia brevicatena]